MGEQVVQLLNMTVLRWIKPEKTCHKLDIQQPRIMLLSLQKLNVNIYLNRGNLGLNLSYYSLGSFILSTLPQFTQLHLYINEYLTWAMVEMSG